jgi:hypothetical protein
MTLWNAVWNIDEPGLIPKGIALKWYCWKPPSQYAWNAVYFLSDSLIGIDQKAEAKSVVENQDALAQ